MASRPGSVPASVTVKTGATVCASSNQAFVTQDMAQVVFDNPSRGPGWNILARAVNGAATFTVTVTQGSGVNRLTWSNQFRCISASLGQNGQVHMTRP